MRASVARFTLTQMLSQSWVLVACLTALLVVYCHFNRFVARLLFCTPEHMLRLTVSLSNISSCVISHSIIFTTALICISLVYILSSSVSVTSSLSFFEKRKKKLYLHRVGWLSLRALPTGMSCLQVLREVNRLIYSTDKQLQGRM